MLPSSSLWHISVMSGSKWGNTGIFGNSRTRPSTNLTVLGAARRKLTASVWLMLVTSMSLTCNNKGNTGVLVRSQARQHHWGSIYCCSQVLLHHASQKVHAFVLRLHLTWPTTQVTSWTQSCPFCAIPAYENMNSLTFMSRSPGRSLPSLLAGSWTMSWM